MDNTSSHSHACILSISYEHTLSFTLLLLYPPSYPSSHLSTLLPHSYPHTYPYSPPPSLSSPIRRQSTTSILFWRHDSSPGSSLRHVWRYVVVVVTHFSTIITHLQLSIVSLRFGGTSLSLLSSLLPLIHDAHLSIIRCCFLFQQQPVESRMTDFMNLLTYSPVTSLFNYPMSSSSSPSSPSSSFSSLIDGCRG